MSKRRFDDYGPGEEYGGDSGGRRFGESRFGGERETKYERKRWDQDGSNDHDKRNHFGSGKAQDYSRFPPPPPPPPPPHRANSDSDSNGSAERKRKRRSRWGNEEKDRVFIPGMPTIIPSNLSKEQEEIYLIQMQIEALTRSMAAGVPDDDRERSPSPEPIYNSEGKRLNTREYRYRKKLEEQRHNLVVKMTALNPNYKPPTDYRPPQTKIFEKVIIPQEEYPEINFVGLIIGPRGNTLKSMERDSSAKIIIRGKGSVKEGKLARKDGQPMPGEDEPLHAFVSGPTLESVALAVSRIKEVIRKGIDLPENQNDLRRSQLRELALLNGTLREHDGPRCTNCGSNNHRFWQCTDKPNITNNVFCTNCNGAGHIARDCREKPASGANKAKIDEEYMSLMAELGEGKAPSSGSNHHHGQQSQQQQSFGHSHGYQSDSQSSGYGGRYGSDRNGSIPQPPPPPPPPPGYGQESSAHHSQPPPPPPPVSQQHSHDKYSDLQGLHGEAVHQVPAPVPSVINSDSNSDSHSQAWAQYYAAAGYTADAYTQAYAGYDWSQYGHFYGLPGTTQQPQQSQQQHTIPPPPPPTQAYAPPPPPPPPSQ